MKLQESGEMYLETIRILSEESSEVRSIDICAYMNFSKPSVSRAMKLLREEGYVNVDNNGFITLTEKGQEIADNIYERHQVLSQMFIDIGVSEETAIEDACRMEHIISQESFDAIKKHIEETH